MLDATQSKLMTAWLLSLSAAELREVVTEFCELSPRLFLEMDSVENYERELDSGVRMMTVDRRRAKERRTVHQVRGRDEKSPATFERRRRPRRGDDLRRDIVEVAHVAALDDEQFRQKQCGHLDAVHVEALEDDQNRTLVKPTEMKDVHVEALDEDHRRDNDSHCVHVLGRVEQRSGAERRFEPRRFRDLGPAARRQEVRSILGLKVEPFLRLEAKQMQEAKEVADSMIDPSRRTRK